MKMKLTKIKLSKKITILLLIILVCIYIFMVISVNNKFPQNKKLLYQHNDVFESQNAEMKVTGATLQNIQLIQNSLSNEEFSRLVKHTYGAQSDNVNLALINLEIFNPSPNPIEVSLLPFHLESNNFSLQACLPFAAFYNDLGMHITLSGKERKNYIFPVQIAKFSFTETEWPNVENRDYYLTYSLYPVKRMVKLNFDT